MNKKFIHTPLLLSQLSLSQNNIKLIAEKETLYIFFQTVLIRILYRKNIYTELSVNAFLILLFSTVGKFLRFLRLDTISQQSNKRDIK